MSISIGSGDGGAADGDVAMTGAAIDGITADVDGDRFLISERRGLGIGVLLTSESRGFGIGVVETVDNVADMAADEAADVAADEDVAAG